MDARGDVGDGVVGNTNRPPQLKSFNFTFNNYMEKDIALLETKFKSEQGQYIFQEEDEGTKHLQGCVMLPKRMRWSSFGLSNKIHWEKTRSWKHSIAYCSDINKRKGRVFSNIKIPDVLEKIEIKHLYGWQLDIIDKIKDRCTMFDRTIHWYWEPDGKTGKTTLVKYLVDNDKVCVTGGVNNNSLYIMAQYLEKNGFPRVVVIDLTRTAENHLSYNAIEQIKNGLIVSGKYESCTIRFNTPHVLVLSNFEPEEHKLSDDRLNIVRIASGGRASPNPKKKQRLLGFGMFD